MRIILAGVFSDNSGRELNISSRFVMIAVVFDKSAVMTERCRSGLSHGSGDSARKINTSPQLFNCQVIHGHKDHKNIHIHIRFKVHKHMC